MTAFKSAGHSKLPYKIILHICAKDMRSMNVEILNHARALQVSDFGLSRVTLTETAISTNTCGTVRHETTAHVTFIAKPPDESGIYGI